MAISYTFAYSIFDGDFNTILFDSINSIRLFLQKYSRGKNFETKKNNNANNGQNIEQCLSWLNNFINNFRLVAAWPKSSESWTIWIMNSVLRFSWKHILACGETEWIIWTAQIRSFEKYTKIALARPEYVYRIDSLDIFEYSYECPQWHLTEFHESSKHIYLSMALNNSIKNRKNVTVSTMKIWDTFIFSISFIRFHFSPDLHIRIWLFYSFDCVLFFSPLWNLCIQEMIPCVRRMGTKKERRIKFIFPIRNRFSNRYVKCGTVSEFAVIKFGSISVSMADVSIRLHVYDRKHRHRHKSWVLFNLYYAYGKKRATRKRHDHKKYE